MNVKIFLSALVAFFSSYPSHAAKNGYLLFSAAKTIYKIDNSAPSKNLEQLYKVKVSADFLAQFKNLPGPQSMGSLFYCALRGQHSKTTSGAGYVQWFSPRPGKLRTWYWVSGFEKVGTKIIPAGSTTSSIQFPSWETLDTSHTVSFLNENDGVNLGVSTIYVSETDPQLKKALTIPIKRVDGSVFITGDSQAGAPFTAQCSFQEG